MFDKVQDADFIHGEHAMLRFWEERAIFRKLRDKNAGKPKWSFLDGPITANNPMGVHHAWGRHLQRHLPALLRDDRPRTPLSERVRLPGVVGRGRGRKELKLGTKKASPSSESTIRQRVQKARAEIRRPADRTVDPARLLDGLGRRPTSCAGWPNPSGPTDVEFTPANGQTEKGKAHNLVERLGNPEWGGSYFTFSTENNETIWTFLKKCFDARQIYAGTT
jgi:isoleucyl-tRNA synthetase